MVAFRGRQSNHALDTAVAQQLLDIHLECSSLRLH